MKELDDFLKSRFRTLLLERNGSTSTELDVMSEVHGQVVIYSSPS
jgi:hypothetical protein